MRYYSYTVPDDDESLEATKYIYSTDEILGEYWDFWTDKMRAAGRSHLINKDTCVDDWCSTHWATEEDIYKFKTGYDGKVFAINEFNLQDPSFSLATLVCLNDNSIDINRFVNLEMELIRLNGLT
jgi:hypothetical protein